MAAPETLSDQARERQRVVPFDRVGGARLVFFAITAALIVFVAIDALSLTYAAIAVAVAAAATVLAEATRQRSSDVVPAATGATAALAPGPIEAMLAGLPDPVVALDRDGIVIAFNAPASVLAPALRRGEPASFALRMPSDTGSPGRSAGAMAPARALSATTSPWASSATTGSGRPESTDWMNTSPGRSTGSSGRYAPCLSAVTLAAPISEVAAITRNPARAGNSGRAPTAHSPPMTIAAPASTSRTRFSRSSQRRMPGLLS